MKSAPKRTAQWVGAVLILAAMVFVLSYAMNFLERESTPPPPKGSDTLRLAFPEPVFPPEGAPIHVCEARQAGFHDYWFHNPNDRDLAIGLSGLYLQGPRKESQDATGKGCRVELFRVPQSSVPELAAARLSWGPLVMPAGMEGPAVLAALPAVAIAQEQKAAHELEEKRQGAALTKENRETIPPGAVGCVRLHWNADRPEPRRLTVYLWTDRPQTEVKTQLEAGLLILPPAMVAVRPPLVVRDDEIGVGALGPRDLPRSWPVYCGSGTRLELSVEAKVEHDGRPEAADPFVVGPVERLSAVECRELEKQGSIPRLLCGYRVMVTLREAAPDGTPLERGRFRRAVRLTCPDAGLSQRVSLEGAVLGDVVVGTRADGGTVQMGSFPAAEGAAAMVPLQSDVTGLELEVDAARTPAFLDVPPLKEPEVTPSGHRTWKLVVRVRPNGVLGKFPSDDNPALRDSAVYVRRKGGPPRTIRIPVVGTANSG